MIRLQVNGTARQFDGDPEMPLLWFLRDTLEGAPASLEEPPALRSEAAGKGYGLIVRKADLALGK